MMSIRHPNAKHGDRLNCRTLTVFANGPDTIVLALYDASHPEHQFRLTHDEARELIGMLEEYLMPADPAVLQAFKEMGLDVQD